ncbi:unnamed protein product [Fraxinus pennsylvanica]|uniref:SHSP domain-containing protein n=1 Tax=Fraxinus pennsylvanica TaxID=56036 RepID=A0AAD1ZP76_9LAMI|nr:unnamed protein product [Fraxinus pennsylvanica]
MSLIPSFFGNRRSNVFDPFSLDIWDPFEDFPFSSSVANVPSSARETSAFANARGVLQISGERSKEQEEKNDKWHRVERSSGKYLRRFRLPENAKTDQVKASMENGVHTVTVPMEEVKKPEVKSIEISG